MNACRPAVIDAAEGAEALVDDAADVIELLDLLSALRIDNFPGIIDRGFFMT
jgi:hypothetical protein